MRVSKFVRLRILVFFGSSIVASHAFSAPNIIFAFSDQHRWHSMGHTAMFAMKTPSMDRIAAEGVSFDLCISNYPVCSPYRAMVMTGRWPNQTQVIDNQIPIGVDEYTIADAFKAKGYATGYIGKWHLGGTTAMPYGFDESIVWSDTNTHFDTSEFVTGTGETGKPEGYNATLMTDQAEDFVRRHALMPFMLMLSWNPPHTDYLDAPDDMKELYPPESLPYRDNYVAPEGTEEEQEQRLWSGDGDEQYRGYHAHVSAIDRELGRLMTLVEELGLRGNTIIVYTSDHGTLLGSHNADGKRQPYDESIRVPLLAWGGPIQPVGKRFGVPVGTIDLMPTLLGAAQIAVPESCEGRDLSRSIIYGVEPPNEPQLIMHIAKENASLGADHPAPLFRGVRTRDHTYVLFPDGKEWLFDDLLDPYQMTNIADQPENRVKKSELRRALGLLLNEAEDPYLRKRPARD